MSFDFSLQQINIRIHSPTEPYTPYNVTVYALNENGNGETTTKINFTVEGGQFVLHFNNHYSINM